MKQDDTSKMQESDSSITSPADYIKTARAYLKGNQRKQAYGVLLQGVADYPENSLILSYYGWLQAVVDKKYHSGIAACRNAFVVFKASNTHTERVVYPILYLNLGRAYVAAQKRKEAVEAFSKGLTHDRHNPELKKELILLGIRKKPPIPFLSRTNPINRLVGLMLGTRSEGRTRRASI